MSDSSPAPEKVEDIYAHYVCKRELERALGSGRSAVALCGMTWRAGRSTKHYPACPDCEKRLLELLRW